MIVGIYQLVIAIMQMTVSPFLFLAPSHLTHIAEVPVSVQKVHTSCRGAYEVHDSVFDRVHDSGQRWTKMDYEGWLWKAKASNQLLIP